MVVVKSRNSVKTHGSVQVDFEIAHLKKHEDKRGFLIEFLKNFELENSEKEFGQIYLVTSAPGAVRGNHYHKKKEEWLVVIAGKQKVTLEDIHTKERKELLLDSTSEYLTRIRVGSNIAHSFRNIADSTSIIVAYMPEIYDPSDQHEYVVSE